MSDSAFFERDLRVRIREKVLEAIAELPQEDQLICRLRFIDGMTIAQIARIQSSDRAVLYRRMERILRILRKGLERRGVTPQDLDDLGD